MSSRLSGVSTPVLLAGAAVLAIVIGAAVALALDSGDDAEPVVEATPTATTPAATATAPPAATATPEPPTPVPPTATVAVSEAWSIELLQTGGFAGVALRLSVDSDGSVTYEDQRAQRTETGLLGADQLADLRALIDSSAFFTQPSPQDAPCADCFNLVISVTLDGLTHTVEAVDIGLDASLEPFAGALGVLLQTGLAP
jgi:hypothetical protein